MVNAGELVLDQLRASLDGSRYSLTAVYAAIVLAFGGGAAVLVGVALAWPKLLEIYAPKPLLASRLSLHHPEKVLDNTFGPPEPNLQACLRRVWTCEEQHLLETEGLDAVVYLRALRMMRNMFFVLTILVFGVAAPVNISFNLQAKYVSNLSKKDALLLLTPTLLSEKQFIPHVVLGWVTNAVVFGFLWYNFRRVLSMRSALFRDPQFLWTLSNRTIVLTNIPKSLRSYEGAARVLLSVNPHEAPSAVSIGHQDTARLAELIENHKAKVLRFEEETMSHPNSSKAQTLLQDLRTLEYSIESNRVILASKSIGAVTPMARFNPFSCYGFASYKTLKSAHAIVVRGRDHNLDSGIHMRLAPPPEQLLWNNLNLTSAQRGTKQFVINVLYGALLIVWIVPSAFIGCFLANLNRLGSVWPAFDRAMQGSPVGFAVLQGILAPLITTMVFAALPVIFRKFSNMQGKITRLDREQEVLRKLYAFFFLDNYFLFTIMGVIWDVVAQVLQQTQGARASGQSLSFREVWNSLRVAQRISTATVNLSSFWVLYLLRSIFALFAGSAQPITLLSRLGQKLNFIQKPTPRARAENSMPQPFQYAVSYLSILFNGTIALGFTSIQPLVLPIAMILFALAIPVRKYMIIYMQITKYESNGLYWPLVNDMTLFATAVGNLILLCVVWTQGGFHVAVGATPLAGTVVVFKIIQYFTLERHFKYPKTRVDSVPNEVDFFADSHEDDPQLSNLYEHPACHASLERPLVTYEDALYHFARRQRIRNLPVALDNKSYVELYSQSDRKSRNDSVGSSRSDPFNEQNAPVSGAIWRTDASANASISVDPDTAHRAVQDFDNYVPQFEGAFSRKR